VAKVGTPKAGGTISQQAAVHPWLNADAHGNKQTNKVKQYNNNNNNNATRVIVVIITLYNIIVVNIPLLEVSV
jgi:hypothetical protein